MNIKTFQPVYGLFSFRKTCNDEKSAKLKIDVANSILMLIGILET